MKKKITQSIINISVAILIFYAVFISALRIIAPQLPKIKQEIITLIETQYHVRVSVEAVHAAMHRLRPTVVIKQVRLFPTDPTIKYVTIKEIKLDIDILASFFQRKFKHSKIYIDGLNLEIKKEKIDGNVQKQQMLAQLLLYAKFFVGQEDISINKSKIHFNNTKQDYLLKISHLRFKSGFYNHKLSGVIILGEDQQQQLDIMADIQHIGDELQDLSMKFYANTYNLSKDGIISQLILQPLGIYLDKADLQFWAYINQGIVNKIFVKSAAQDLNIKNKSIQHHAKNVNADLYWESRPKAHHVVVDINKMLLNTQSIKPMQLTFDKFYEKNYVIVRSNSLDLENINKIIKSFRKNINKEINIHIPEEFQLGGILSQFVFHIPLEHSSEKYSFYGNFTNLEFGGLKPLPHVIGLNGNAICTLEFCKIQIDSDVVDIKKNTIFNQDVILDDVDIDIEWKNFASGIKIELPQISFDFEGLKVNGEFALDKQPGTSDFMQFYFAAQGGDIHELSAYAPKKVLPKVLQRWLSSAFIQGNIDDLMMVYNGPIVKFPFKDNLSGTFMGQARVENSILKFDEHWPTIENIDATISLDKDSLFIHSNQATINGAHIKNANVNIHDLGNKNKVAIEVDGNTKATLAQGVDYLLHTPLKQNIGQTLNSINPNGDISLDLILHIPLGLQSEVINVTGNIASSSTSIFLPGINKPLKSIQGNMKFTQAGFYAQNINAKLFNTPVNINADTIKLGKKNTLIFNAKTQMDVRTIKNKLEIPILNLFEGKTKFNAKINIPLNYKAPGKFKLYSDLKGIQSDMPAPFAKDKLSIIPFSLTTLFYENSDIGTNIRYGNDISIQLANDSILHGEELRAQVAFGDTKVKLPKKNGLELVGKLPNVDIDPWLYYIQERKKNDVAINIRTDVLLSHWAINGYQFNNTRVKLDHSYKKTVIYLAGRDVEGVIKYPHQQAATVDINLNRLNLKHSKTVKTLKLEDDIANKVSNRRYAFSCKKVNFNSLSLGKVNFIADLNTSSLKFSKLLIQNSDFNISSTGNINFDSNKTVWSGKLNTNRLERLINHVYKTKALTGGKGSIVFNLNWQGWPVDLNIRNASGQVALNLTEGQIESVQPGIGRLLSILSIKSLQRRLKLDFSDLTQKGFVFDSIKGDVNFNSGNFTTEDMKVYGPAANIHIAGNMHLPSSKLNLSVLVNPNLTASLPLAAAIAAGNPAVGAVVWILDKILSSQIEDITQYRYKVTGNIQSPNFRHVS